MMAFPVGVKEVFMTDKELKKLNRAELLEMLIAQSKEVVSLKEQLQSAKKMLEDRRIMMENAGSIAEASLQLNGVFEAAQNAAAQYLENIQRQAEICADMEKKSRERAEQLLNDAKIKCSNMENESQKKCRLMLEIVQEQMSKCMEKMPEKRTVTAVGQPEVRKSQLE